jgi:pyridoxal phosphate enzyme (YggS family)
VTDARRAEIATGLDDVRRRIATAAEAAGRDPDDVTLIVVTKTWPVSDIALLRELGVRDIGENRHQEAEHKAHELAHLDITWHFIGQVQSNKATRIAGYADLVHSVDSVKVARRLQRGAHDRGHPVDCMVQINLDPAEQHAGRGGLDVDTIDAVAAEIEQAGQLRLVGVMGVAPLGQDPRPAYERLVEISHELRVGHPAARLISAGMSGDFEVAVAAGATHVRVGSAILGERPPLG